MWSFCVSLIRRSINSSLFATIHLKRTIVIFFESYFKLCLRLFYKRCVFLLVCFFFAFHYCAHCMCFCTISTSVWMYNDCKNKLYASEKLRLQAVFTSENREHQSWRPSVSLEAFKCLSWSAIFIDLPSSSESVAAPVRDEFAPMIFKSIFSLCRFLLVLFCCFFYSLSMCFFPKAWLMFSMTVALKQRIVWSWVFHQLFTFCLKKRTYIEF